MFPQNSPETTIYRNITPHTSHDVEKTWIVLPFIIVSIVIRDWAAQHQISYCTNSCSDGSLPTSPVKRNLFSHNGNSGCNVEFRTVVHVQDSASRPYRVSNSRATNRVKSGAFIGMQQIRRTKLLRAMISRILSLRRLLSSVMVTFK